MWQAACSNPDAPTTRAAASSAASTSAVAPVTQGPPDGNMSREQIPDQFKWKLDALFPSDEAFDKALGTLGENRTKLATFRGKLADPKQLLECLQLYFDTRLITNKATLYAAQRLDTDQRNTKLQAMNEQAQSALHGLMAQAAFIRQEVLALDEAKLQAAYSSEPKLVEYRPYLDELRRRRSRVGSAEVERVLALAGDNLWAEVDLNEIPSDFEKAFDAVLADLPMPTIKDEKGRDAKLTLASFTKYRASEDRRVRKDAVEGLFGTLKQFEHATAATLSGQIRFNIFLARARGYDTALEAYLDKDNIAPAVYHNLIEAVHDNLAPLHKYIRLRKQVMGVEQLHVYDLYTPMVKGIKMQVPYAKAVEILPEALAPLGSEYITVLKTGLDPAQGWVDVYPHKDKKSGAFCSAVYGVHPFVKLNYFDDLGNLSTMAHEFGHALHSYLSIQNQPYVSANYPAFIAEIASTTNEKLLSDYLLANAKSDDEKLYLLNELVERIRQTVYRQALFAEFELAAHSAAEKGLPLTAEWLNKTYRDLITRYYGPDFTIGENDGVEWSYVPHFYYKYYVYAYATGLSSGLALAEKIATGDAAARDAYLGMLKGGSSKPPLELLKGAGVDLTKPDVIVAAARVMDQKLQQMEELLANRKKQL